MGARAVLKDSRAWRELFLALLAGAGHDLSGVVQQEYKGRLELSLFFESRLFAFRFFRMMKGWRLRNTRIFIRRHAEKDWSTRWKKSWKPFSLTRRFYVVPLCQPDRRIPKGKEAVYIDTTSAFGTGLHETTRFTAGLMGTLSGQFGSFLDVGTGSGILLVVARKCGAEYTAALDIDPEAIRVARQNLSVNKARCDSLTVCDLKRYPSRKKFDLVAANLVTRDLITCRKKLVALVRQQGFLAVSGVSLGNMSLFEREFIRSPLKLLKLRKGREWAAYLFVVRKGG